MRKQSSHTDESSGSDKSSDATPCSGSDPPGGTGASTGTDPARETAKRPDRDAGASTEAFYDRWAGLYDRVATLPPVRAWRQRAADTLRLQPGDTVVEMGCGTGANLPHLRERVGPGGRVIGLDLTMGVIHVARRRVARAGWTNVHCCRGDARAPPLAGEVDAVLSTFVVGMLPDPGATVGTWLECLAPGGRLALMNAAPTERILARPLNLPFGLFVWASAPGDGGGVLRSKRDLAVKIATARRALERAGDDVSSRRFALGFLRLTAGTRPQVE